MTFHELIQLVRDENLPADLLELYRDKIAEVAVAFQMELADLQKAEALFMGAKKDGQSVADRKIEFKITEKGQRLIEVKNYLTTAKILMRSLKDRWFVKFKN